MTHLIFRRRYFHLGSAALLLALGSCATPQSRGPASDLPPIFQDGFVPYAQKILAHVSAKDFGTDTCVPYLQNVQAEIAQIQPDVAPQDEMVGHAPELIQILWNVRLTLHQRLSEFSAPCVKEIRNTARLMRFIEDFLAEHAGHVQGLDADKMDFSKQETPVLTPSANYLTLISPDYANFEFKNGDLMIARGPSFLSAIISRVGDVSSQFSHLIMVHVDQTTHKVETIESYVGVGVGIYDLDFALKNGNVRLLLLRAKDQDMASKAADFIYAKTKAAIASGHPIRYDYKFDFKEHSTVSCAEVAEWGFEEASDGKVILPYYPSTISEQPGFLKRVGMKQGETFTPGDMEVDPRFDMVMEWRDLRLTRDSRVKDSILTSMLNWMALDQYELHDTMSSTAAGDIIWPARRTFLWPLVKKFLKVPGAAQPGRRSFSKRDENRGYRV